MATIQRQSKLPVLGPVDRAWRESGDNVAGGAVARIVPAGELTTMSVLMAIAASRGARTDANPRGPEPNRGDRRKVLAMAFGTGHGLMLALERIGPVLSHRIGRRCEPHFGMAHRAVGRLALQRRGATVRIWLVTGGTGRRPGPPSRFAGKVGMTGSAFDAEMPTPKREPGSSVVEPTGRRDLTEAVRGVTVRTPIPEAPLVDVAMARATALSWYGPVDRNRPPCRIPLKGESRTGMALVALDRAVLAGQRIAGGIVIESWGRGPAGGVVTVGAAVAERAAVNVLMATPTRGLETRPVRPTAGGKTGRGPATQAIDVTRSALELGVRLLERPPSFTMVESGCAARRPPDQLERLTSVIGVAATAGCGLGASSAMEAPAPSSKPFDVSMTAQAPTVHRLFSAPVALSAFEGALQRPVGTGQWTG